MHVGAGDDAVDHRVGAPVELDGAVDLLRFQCGGDDVAVDLDDGDDVTLGADEAGLELRQRPWLSAQLPCSMVAMLVDVEEVLVHDLGRVLQADRWSGLARARRGRRRMVAMRQLVPEPGEACQNEYGNDGEGQVPAQVGAPATARPGCLIMLMRPRS